MFGWERVRGSLTGYPRQVRFQVQVRFTAEYSFNLIMTDAAGG